ncbi:hypothetical protein F7725_004698 [Dissostichus mawsoni]|uniref:Ig-like domain-containing protein n=1 Tax=Dissostichus mawsoni TaxID=36200 RepID=A0A7J5XJI9_DISMA|nr:hypothetical protein F7725_004698 [Dissostichus mawsoni]
MTGSTYTITNDTRRELTISAVSKSDEGFYKCKQRDLADDTPEPVLTVSPSWPSPGASVTLNCRVDHPSAGWSFYWYKAVPQNSDNSYSYELLPGSENGTEEDLFIIDGQTHTAGYVCRAGRGDPVFYSWHNINSAASLTVSPDSVQHFTKTQMKAFINVNREIQQMCFEESVIYKNK